jgi:hypothetical protein
MADEDWSRMENISNELKTDVLYKYLAAFYSRSCDIATKETEITSK